jgi:anti-anti-sigma factor
MDVEMSQADRESAVPALHGELDMDTAVDVDYAVQRCLLAALPVLLLDLTDISFCDSSGLNALIQANRQATAAGGAVHLVAPRPRMARVPAPQPLPVRRGSRPWGLR